MHNDAVVHETASADLASPKRGILRRLPVLVIEEDAALAEYIAHLLDELGCEPFVAKSLAHALRLIGSRAYSLILADYFDPVERLLHRWPTLQLVARFASRTPVVAVSATGVAPTEKNIVDILKLPFDETGFAQKLERNVVSRPRKSSNALLARYLGALLDADIDEVAKVILETTTAGWGAERVYLDLFAAGLYEIGDLWEQDSCSIADEHGARAITERLMAKISSTVKSQPLKGRSILVSCTVSERHELGARMVADLFTWDGWNVHYMGADTPEVEIAAETHRRQVQVVGLSATIRPSWGIMKAQIAMLREAGARIVILGGQAFRTLDQAGVAALGADGRSEDARAGVDLANKLLSERNARGDDAHQAERR